MYSPAHPLVLFCFIRDEMPACWASAFGLYVSSFPRGSIESYRSFASPCLLFFCVHYFISHILSLYFSPVSLFFLSRTHSVLLHRLEVGKKEVRLIRSKKKNERKLSKSPQGKVRHRCGGGKRGRGFAFLIGLLARQGVQVGGLGIFEVILFLFFSFSLSATLLPRYCHVVVLRSVATA